MRETVDAARSTAYNGESCGYKLRYDFFQDHLGVGRILSRADHCNRIFIEISASDRVDDEWRIRDPFELSRISFLSSDDKLHSVRSDEPLDLLGINTLPLFFDLSQPLCREESSEYFYIGSSVLYRSDVYS